MKCKFCGSENIIRPWWYKDLDYKVGERLQDFTKECKFVVCMDCGRVTIKREVIDLSCRKPDDNITIEKDENK